MRRFLLILVISAALTAQTSPPDLTGTWILGGPGWNGVVVLTQRSAADFYGRVERVGQDPRPITGTIRPGAPNPNVLAIRIEEHATSVNVPNVSFLYIWEGYTTGPNTIEASMPDLRGQAPGLQVAPILGWTLTRFNPAPTPPPVATPSPESVKLDTLAIAVDRLQTILQSILDQLAALKPQN